MDYHAAGEPFRIITGGVLPIPGATILDKRRHALKHLDHIRRLVVNEPRGHADMYGCFVTDPVSEDGDLGVLFFHNAGFSTACGHGTIALVTSAIESGMLPGEVLNGERRVVVDAPSGRLETVARINPTGAVTSVRFRNVPAFVETPSLTVEIPGVGPVEVSIAYGGAFYALLDSEQVGLRVEPEALDDLIAYGRAIKAAVEEVHLPVHPLEPELRGIYGVIFAQNLEPGTGEAPRVDVNVTIFADGEVDRSPCGSGTSARLAMLCATDRLGLGQTLQHRSIIGTEFIGRATEPAHVAGQPAVITEVEGSAHLTGYHTFVLEPEDPLGTGFLLR